MTTSPKFCLKTVLAQAAESRRLHAEREEAARAALAAGAAPARKWEHSPIEFATDCAE